MCVGYIRFIQAESASYAREQNSTERDSLARPDVEIGANEQNSKESLSNEELQARVTWLEGGSKQLVRLVNEETQKVILQIPSDEVLKVSATISGLLEGEQQNAIDIES